MSFGNIHVGDEVTLAYQVANTGTAGASLRGAVQTAAGGGNLTDARLSGSGVAAGDFGPLAVGSATADRTVTLTGSAAGALVGQSVAIVNNFDNVAGQVLAFEGAVYRYAAPSTHSPAPVAFGNRHVGDAVQQVLSLTNTATADGYSEALNANLALDAGAVGVNAAGAFELLAAGATNNADLVVSLDTTTAGAKSGTATLSLVSDGFGTSGLGQTVLANQTVDISGSVYRFAEAGPIAAVEFANAHVGDVVSKTLSVSNTAVADGYSERLNASFVGVSDTRIQVAGAIDLLGAGSTDDTSLIIALDTSTAGSLTGFATLGLVSDGFGTSGLGQTSLGTRNVGVTTNIAVYRYAEGEVNDLQPLDLGAWRVGDLSGARALSITNTAADDGFSEHLNAAVDAVADGFTAQGAVSLLAPEATAFGGIVLGVDTNAAGVKAGTATIGFVSDGSGTSELGQTARGSTDVTLAARVYAPAVAEVQTTGLDFGIVHVGDNVAARAVAVKNAGSGALVDGLMGSVLATPSGFSGAGTLGAAGLTAGEVDSSALTVALDTSVAGLFAGQAALSFASRNAELADLDLGITLVAVQAQVNHFANPVMTHSGGDGSLSANGAEFSFDFGRLIEGEPGVLGLLALTNLVSGPADALRAEFTFGSGPFALSGFENFTGLGAGTSQALAVGFDPLVIGLFEQVVSIDLYGHNASGYDGFIGTYTLTFRAEVAPVPVPTAIWFLLSGLGMLWRVRGRTRRRPICIRHYTDP